VIGRDFELDQIAAGVQSALRGEGGAFFLFGEAGIGKSRVVAEASDLARTEGLAVIAGRAGRGRVEPFSALVAALMRVARRLTPADLNDDAVLRAGLRALRLDRPRRVSAPVSPLLVAETVLRLAARLGNGGGAVVVVEDLQWADADTLAVCTSEAARPDVVLS
jgi:predicted ATPase